MLLLALISTLPLDTATRESVFDTERTNQPREMRRELR